VADSRGSDEATEAAAKASPLLRAIGAAAPPPALAPPPRGVPRFARHGPRPVPRPDPDAGVYETVRIVDGLARRWPAHRARLAGSLAALYGAPLPTDLDVLVRDAGRGLTDGRLRIDVVPGEAPALSTTRNPRAKPAMLRPVRLAGGLGAHKWRDRTLLEALEADDPATLPLLVDADGRVLETSRTAIVVCASDGTLWTPPADGRILPSVTAAACGARPRRLTLSDLQAASAIYVASALRELQAALLASSSPHLTAVR
jgi:para-aminobenzoate synthetase/4-amino-4-deoxychorismate lyase